MSEPADRDEIVMAQQDADDVWVVTRSMLDPRVWLPYGHEGDQSCFLYAGGLKAVKAWVESREDMTGLHWVKHNPDTWLLIYREPGDQT